MTNRDFVSKRTYATDYKGNKYVMHVAAHDHASKPPNKKFVRGVVLNSGHVLNPLDGGKKTKIQVCIHVDIKVIFFFPFKIFFSFKIFFF